LPSKDKKKDTKKWQTKEYSICQSYIDYKDNIKLEHLSGLDDLLNFQVIDDISLCVVVYVNLQLCLIYLFICY